MIYVCAFFCCLRGAVHERGIKLSPLAFVSLFPVQSVRCLSRDLRGIKRINGGISFYAVRIIVATVTIYIYIYQPHLYYSHFILKAEVL